MSGNFKSVLEVRTEVCYIYCTFVTFWQSGNVIVVSLDFLRYILWCTLYAYNE